MFDEKEDGLCSLAAIQFFEMISCSSSSGLEKFVLLAKGVLPLSTTVVVIPVIFPELAFIAKIH